MNNSKSGDRPFSCPHPTLERNNRRNNHERYTSNFEIAIFIPQLQPLSIARLSILLLVCCSQILQSKTTRSNTAI